jgi:hypothetical protein
MSGETETVRQKVWVAYSEDTGILGVRYTAEEAQLLVDSYLTGDREDELGEWRYGAHGLWSAKAKKWGANFFVERYHFDMPKNPDMDDIRPEEEKV